MAVCGRCLLCGYKFNGKDDETGTELDAPIIAPCEVCPPSTWDDEKREHKICLRCHDALTDRGGELTDAVRDLIALVSARSSDFQPLRGGLTDRERLAEALSDAIEMVRSYHDRARIKPPANEVAKLEAWQALAAKYQ